MARKTIRSPRRKAAAKAVRTVRAKRPAVGNHAPEPKPPASPVAFRLSGLISGRDTGMGLPGLRVEAVDKDLRYEQPLGSTHTDDQGRYEIAFTSEQVGKAEKGGPDIVVRVFDQKGAALGESEMLRNAPTEATIDLAIAPKQPAALKEIAAGLKLHLPPTLLQHLGARGIHTLADIRRAGGLGSVEGLGVAPGDPVLKVLDAQAQLSVLPSDPATNAALIKAGYAGLADIAGTSRQAFVASLGGAIRAIDAETIHAAAGAQVHFLANVITDFRAGAAGTAQAKYGDTMEKVIPQICGCENCKNATSPMAYLADLLDFALRHLKTNGAAVTLTFLQGRFHQPFRDLPATCELMEKKVRQVRICIEVLRQHLPAPYKTSASQWYLETAYASLLQGIGTSFDEIRQLRSVTDFSKRQAVAARLGIPLRRQRALPNDPDELDRLFLDTDYRTPANPAWPMKLSEAQLEQLFGLRDTKRPALDPDVTSEIFTARMHYLRSGWHAQDRSASSTLGEIPIIDPDLVGEADLRDATPNPTPRVNRNKITWSPLDFLEDRRAWIATTIGELDQSRRTSSLTQLLDLLQTNVFLLGGTGMEGITVPVLLRLRRLKQSGQDVTPLLLPLRLEQDELDYLSHIAELDRNGDPILDSEWSEFYSIVVARIKKYVEYGVWRNEETRNPLIPDSGITLGPDYFRVRPASFAGGELEWLPDPWRASVAARRKWEDTLRARIEQEQAVIAGLQEAVDATEDAVLVHLRDELRIAAGTVGTGGVRTPNELTGYLQIDVEAAGCQMTTRVAQAIETVQGLLFGARNGLLEDDTLTLDADHFDEEWQWIGSYATWRAAMYVFLYPENALRPTLRRLQSRAFMDLIASCRSSSGHLSAADAETVAGTYANYFKDVCSLSFEALGRSFFAPAKEIPPDRSGLTGSYFLVVARGDSGTLYYCLQDMPPYWWLTSGYRRTIWNAIPGMERGAQLRAIFPYYSSAGWFIALHVEVPTLGSEAKAYTFSFDGVAWGDGIEGGLPALFCSATVADAVIPAAPGLASSGVTEWRVSTLDHMALLDVDGDGRKELLLIADSVEPDQTRRMGLVREENGGLILDRIVFLPQGWSVPAGDPMILRMKLVQSPSRRREGLVLVRNAAGRTDVGVAGQADSGAFGLVVNTTTGSVADANGLNPWSMQGDTRFIAVDLDGDGYSELVALDREYAVTDFRGTTTVLQDLTVVRVRETGLTVLRRRPTEPVQKWFAVPDSQEIGHGVLVIQRSGRVYPTGALQLPSVQVLTTTALTDRGASENIAVLQPSAPPPLGFDDATVDPATWSFARDDRFLPFNFDPLSPGHEVLLTSDSRIDSSVLALEPPPPVSVPTGGGQHPPVRSSFGMMWRTAGRIEPAETGSAQTWRRQIGDRFVAADLDGDGAQEILVMSPDNRLAGVLGRGASGALEVGQTSELVFQGPIPGSSPEWRLSNGTRCLVGDIDGDGSEEILVLAGGGRLGILRGVPPLRGPLDLGMRDSYGPSSVKAKAILPKNPSVWPAERQGQIQLAYESNIYFPHDPDLVYLDEAYYFVPMELALRLRESGDYTTALDWFRSVYDYDRAPADRKISYKLVLDGGEPDFQRNLDWLQDPLNPHAIAEIRRNSYTKFAVLAIVRCLLDFADSEFARATSESIPRARELYLTALGLLDSPELKQHMPECSDLIGQLVIQVGSEEEIWIGYAIRDTLRQLKSLEKLAGVVKQLQPLMLAGDGLPARLRQAQKIVADAVKAEDPAKTPTFATLADERAKALRAASVAVMMDDAVSDAVEHVGALIHESGGSEGLIRRVALDSGRDAAAIAVPRVLEPVGGARILGEFQYLPAPSLSFCIPPNPVIQAALSHAELCLHKIRTCRNIAGMELHVDPYAAPTAADAGVQTLGSGDQLPSVPVLNFQPLPYRYAVLIERTKQLVELARQMENSMLSFLASADQEKYQEIKARQDLALTQAGVRLKDLQLTQADDGVAGAQLQRDRAQMQVDAYRGLIDAGLSTWETAALVAQAAAVVHLHTAAAITEATTFGIGGIGEVGGALAATSQLFQMQASFERREQEWRTQKALAEQDVRIGQQQTRLAQDQMRVAAQERAISALQVDHAEQILTFLTSKFTGYDLYEWMSGVIQQVYRFFLQQATSMAQAAERQLAFERQEIPSTFIQVDYWEPPSQGQSPDFSPPSVSGQATSLRGLTGSARLLRDVYELDQYAFLKNQRKLQLTETISLAQLDPFAFERFRENGVLPFSTPMSLFDHKFPGHYLRLIKRVRTSVIALIPPAQGIRATLSTTGTSRSVIGNDTFDSVTIQRGPEAVALSSPVNATGLFELDTQPELLVPFEGIGVDTNWEFRLPKAANLFDYRTLADVLITVEYTALDSFDYRQQVLQDLDRRVSVDRAFSFRMQFPDPWYDLHNPDQATPPAMTVHFRTERDDFPPNLEDESLSIGQVVLYFSRAGGKPFTVPLTTSLQFIEQKTGTTAGGTVTTTELALSTRRGNAMGWGSMLGKSPVGDWTLTLPADARTRSYFDSEEIEDILLVITYSGQTPKWPM